MERQFVMWRGWRGTVVTSSACQKWRIWGVGLERWLGNIDKWEKVKPAGRDMSEG